MTTLQHSLITFLADGGDIDKFEKELPYLLYPDAIRKYSIPRQYSHFEKPIGSKDVTWLKFPKDIKEITQEKVDAFLEKIPKEEKKVFSMGDVTNLSAFEQKNRHLKPDYFFGVKKHLIQDKIFDKFVRTKIDDSRKKEDVYFFNNKKLNGKQIRKVIDNIEETGLYMLSYMIYWMYGETTNQAWFDEHVKKVLDRQYPKDLSRSTYKYMKIPEELNKKITQHDWSGVKDGVLDTDEYRRMYEEVIRKMLKVDIEKNRKQKAKEF